MYNEKTTEERYLELIRGRMNIFLSIMIAGFALMGLRLWQLTVLESDDLTDRAYNNRVRMITLAGIRGELLDRNGRTIISSRPGYNLAIMPESAGSVDRVLNILSRRVEINHTAVKEKIKKSLPFKSIVIKKDLSRDEVAYVEEMRYYLPGISLEVEPLRDYRYGELGAHAVGYIREISELQLKNLKEQGYEQGDSIGQYGIEKRHEALLRGKKGYRLIEVNSIGRELQVIDQALPSSGSEISLTIDLDIQQAAEAAMKDKHGAVVVIDPRSGEILALVSEPAFNPNDFVGELHGGAWAGLVTDPSHPLQNRAIQGQYPPGSTYKIVTAAAGLQEKVVTPQTTFTCTGAFRWGRRSYGCWKRGGHGVVNLHKALVESCDVYFYNVGLKLGIDTLAKYAFSFGLGNITGVHLIGEKPGLIPTVKWKEANRNEPWMSGETVSASIGQGYDLVTPIQMSRLIAAVANGGTLYRPRLLKEVAGKPASQDDSTGKEEKVRVSESNMELIRKALLDVVEDPHGTAHWTASVKDMKIAGKTGTAQVVRLNTEGNIPDDLIPFEQRDHAWFVAFAPYDNPQLAIAVLVEHGGHGASAAAPVAKAIVQEFIRAEAERTAAHTAGPPDEQPENRPADTPALPQPQTTTEVPPSRTAIQNGRG